MNRNREACKRPQIQIIKSGVETGIYFRPKEVDLDAQAIEDTLNSLVVSNSCSGFNSERLLHGDIRVYFNPLCHTVTDEREVEKRVISSLKPMALSPEE